MGITAIPGMLVLVCDFVRFECPQCNVPLEEQSTSGPCVGYHYELKSAPLHVLVGVDDHMVLCPHCASWFHVVVEPRVFLERWR